MAIYIAAALVLLFIVLLFLERGYLAWTTSFGLGLAAWAQGGIASPIVFIALAVPYAALDHWVLLTNDRHCWHSMVGCWASSS